MSRPWLEVGKECSVCKNTDNEPMFRVWIKGKDFVRACKPCYTKHMEGEE